MHDKANLLTWIAILVSLGCFAVSLPLPAFHLRSGPPATGLAALQLGWWGVLSYQFGWFANPFYLAALVCAGLGKRHAAQILILIALGLGASSVLIQAWHEEQTSSSVEVVRMGSAFYVWMASFGVLLAGVLLARYGQVSVPP